MGGERHRYVFLDGLRGIAALIVVVFHACQTNGLPTPRFAPLAVDFFFLLSGFVLAHAFEARLRAGGYRRRFLVLRFIRLYPMIVFGTGAGLAITAARMAVVHDIAPAQFLSVAVFGLLVLPTYALPQYSSAFPENLVVWSLFFEIIVNLLYAGVSRRLTGRALVAVVAASAVSLLVIVATLGSMEYGPDKHLLVGGLPRASFSFFAGILIFRLGARPFSGRLGGNAVAFGLAGGFAVLLLARADLPQWWDLPIVLVLFPVLLAASSRTNVTGGAARACLALGALSYPLYLIHFPLLRAVAAVHRHGHTSHDPRLAATEVVASVLLGTVVLLGYEQPARLLLGRLLLNRRRRPVDKSTDLLSATR